LGRGRVDFVLGVDFHGYNFLWRGKFPGVNILGKFLHLGSDRILIQNSFYSSYFLFANSILHVAMFWDNCPGKIFSVFRYPGKKFHGKGKEILWRGDFQRGWNCPVGIYG
jgi:hypothetical protein